MNTLFVDEGIIMEMKDILRQERLKKNLTHQQVADILKMERGSYTKYETGANTPPLDKMMILADLYKTSIDYLAGRYVQNKED